MERKQSIKETLTHPENRELITDWLAANKGGNRTNLAGYACERLDFRDAKGCLRISTTLKALRDLEAEGCWRLPELTVNATGRWNPRRLDCAVVAPRGVPGQVEEIKGLELVEVRADDEAHLRIWNEMMLSEHPLRDCRLVGRQLRYLIGSAHGWLGGIGFGSSALYLESRDKWIGWDRGQRTEYNSRIVNMTRFLIRDGVGCRNLASHVLGMCGKRVADDFHRRYGYRPWLMESFVDRDMYEGTCYQASNWICVGQTKGRGRNGSNKAGKSIKDVYMYPLVSNFRNRMGVGEADELSALAVDSGLESERWAEQEFGCSQLGDERLSARLVKIAGSKGKRPGTSYARASQGDRHALKGYYRFINNDRRQMSSAAILGGHREQTIRRMKNEKTVLVIQDTMDLNFSTRLHCEDLGPIGKNQTGAESLGLKMHSALALNTVGLPLGVLRVQTYAPEAKQGKADAGRPIEEKESYRWLEIYRDANAVAGKIAQTHVVCIGDRESDIFELFDQRRRQGGRVDLLVRAKHNRCLEDTEKKLFEQLADGEADGLVSIAVPRQREKKGKPSKPGRKSLPARTAQVEVRFREIEIRAPQTPQLRHKKPIRLFATYLLEKNPPPDATQIKWMLLTTIEIRSLKQAMKCVRWYCLRWRIEEWHRVLKSGCRVLEHQNHTAESLIRAIAIDAVIGWRIMLLTLLGREVPEMPCSLLFDPWECEVLKLLAQKKIPCLLAKQ
jgi:hypothetical protein